MAAFWLTAVAVLMVDRVAKLATLSAFTLGEHIAFWPGVLEWRVIRNEGMALGLLSGQYIASLVLPVLVVLVGWLIMRRYCQTLYTRVAAGLVVGGFLGNLLDRLLMGFVLDMIYFPWMPWYVCNLADIAICFGVALLAVSLLFRPRDWRLRAEVERREPNRVD